MRSKARLAVRVFLRLARLPRPASSAQRSRRLRSTRAAAPVLLAHANVTKNIKYFSMGPKLRYPTGGGCLLAPVASRVLPSKLIRFVFCFSCRRQSERHPSCYHRSLQCCASNTPNRYSRCSTRGHFQHLDEAQAGSESSQINCFKV